MKVSVSLPGRDVEFLDAYASTHGERSRSAAVRAAVQLLRAREMADDYAAAWDEWDGTDQEFDWDAVTADGLGAR